MGTPTGSRSRLLGMLAGLTVAMLGAGALAVAGPAQADSYTATVATSCNSSAVKVVPDSSSRPKLTIAIGTVGNAHPVGHLVITYLKLPGGRSTTQTVPYRGSTVHVTGPVLSGHGAYRAKVRFEAAKGSVWKPCQSSAYFKRVQAVSDTTGNQPGQTGQTPGQGPGAVGDNNGSTGPGATSPSGGLLPNTGSPVTLTLLLAALALLVIGASLVVESRRPRRRRRHSRYALSPRSRA